MIQKGRANSSVTHQPTFMVVKAISQARGESATQLAKKVGRSP